MTCWQSLVETVGIPRHFLELPYGNSCSHRDLLPAFDPQPLTTKGFNSVQNVSIIRRNIPQRKAVFLYNIKYAFSDGEYCA